MSSPDDGEIIFLLDFASHSRITTQSQVKHKWKASFLVSLIFQETDNCCHWIIDWNYYFFNFFFLAHTIFFFLGQLMVWCCNDEMLRKYLSMHKSQKLKKNKKIYQSLNGKQEKILADVYDSEVLLQRHNSCWCWNQLDFKIT